MHASLPRESWATLICGAGSGACAESCAQGVTTEFEKASAHHVAATSHIPQQQGAGSLVKTGYGINGVMTVHIAAGAGITPTDTTTFGKLDITQHLESGVFQSPCNHSMT